MQQRSPNLPAPGELWLSRPPYNFLTHVRAVRSSAGRITIDYELLDDDGSVLTVVEDRLDASWWRNFQPVKRRFG